MKQFVNKATEITSVDEQGNKITLDYAELAKLTLNITPKEGWSMKTMRSRFKIEDKFKDAEIDAVIELDDADVEKLKEVADIPWQFKHRDILGYIDHLEELLKD
jgi:Cu/Ag efflux protein CusF